MSQFSSVTAIAVDTSYLWYNHPGHQAIYPSKYLTKDRPSLPGPSHRAYVETSHISFWLYRKAVHDNLSNDLRTPDYPNDRVGEETYS